MKNNSKKFIWPPDPGTVPSDETEKLCELHDQRRWSDHHAETCVEISSSGNPSQGCLPERHRRRISDPQIHGDRNAAASRKKWFYCAGKAKKKMPV